MFEEQSAQNVENSLAKADKVSKREVDQQSAEQAKAAATPA